MLVWALPVSLAATPGITVVFSSSGYLDVSVRRVPLLSLWIGLRIHEVCSWGFPHSDISGSLGMCPSPKLFAAYHVFHRLLVPRHPPYALSSMTKMTQKAALRLQACHWKLASIRLCCIVSRHLRSKWHRQGFAFMVALHSRTGCPLHLHRHSVAGVGSRSICFLSVFFRQVLVLSLLTITSDVLILDI